MKLDTFLMQQQQSYARYLERLKKELGGSHDFGDHYAIETLECYVAILEKIKSLSGRIAKLAGVAFDAMRKTSNPHIDKLIALANKIDPVHQVPMLFHPCVIDGHFEMRANVHCIDLANKLVDSITVFINAVSLSFGEKQIKKALKRMCENIQSRLLRASFNEPVAAVMIKRNELFSTVGAMHQAIKQISQDGGRFYAHIFLSYVMIQRHISRVEKGALPRQIVCYARDELLGKNGIAYEAYRVRLREFYNDENAVVQFDYTPEIMTLSAASEFYGRVEAFLNYTSTVCCGRFSFMGNPKLLKEQLRRSEQHQQKNESALYAGVDEWYVQVNTELRALIKEMKSFKSSSSVWGVKNSHLGVMQETYHALKPFESLLVGIGEALDYAKYMTLINLTQQVKEICEGCLDRLAAVDCKINRDSLARVFPGCQLVIVFLSNRNVFRPQALNSPPPTNRHSASR